MEDHPLREPWCLMLTAAGDSKWGFSEALAQLALLSLRARAVHSCDLQRKRTVWIKQCVQ